MSEKLGTQFIRKPSNLPNHDLVALIGLYDTPQGSSTSMIRTYDVSQLAVNESKGIVQVYVTANTGGGLQAFRADYPNAMEQEDATLSDPDEWRVIAFPSEEMPDESTALDNYYQARSNELEKNLGE